MVGQLHQSRSCLGGIILTVVITISCIFVIVIPNVETISTRIGLWLRVEKAILPQNQSVEGIFVLGGNTEKRTLTALKYFEAGTTKTFVITGYDPHLALPFIDTSYKARQRAIESGIPEAIVHVVQTSSTLEDGQQIAQMIARQSIQNVLIVSDWTHGRRAICTIQAESPSKLISFYFVATNSKFSYVDWWRSSDGREAVLSELGKMSVYLVRDHIQMWGCFQGDLNLLSYLLIAGSGFLLSYWGVEWVRRNAVRLKTIDIPNERSSHTVPTPRGGGVGIVISVLSLWLLSLVLLPAQVDLPIGVVTVYAVVGGGLALIGWLDDRHSLGVFTRFISYLVIIALFSIVVGTVTNVDPQLFRSIQFWQPLAVALSILWLTGFLNLFNFMDGIDGLAATQAILASIFWLIVFLMEGEVQLALLSLLLIAASSGFFFHNRPPARIFMGDAGSTFLGFSLAALPLMGYAQTNHPKLLVVGILFVMPFLFDATLTIFRRLRHKQNIFKPHRTHLYQRLVIAGYSHGQVTRQYAILIIVSGMLGFMYLGSSGWLGLVEIIAALAIHGVYTVYVSATELISRREPRF